MEGFTLGFAGAVVDCSKSPSANSKAGSSSVETDEQGSGLRTSCSSGGARCGASCDCELVGGQAALPLTGKLYSWFREATCDRELERAIFVIVSGVDDGVTAL